MVNLSSFLLVVKFLAIVYIHDIYLAPSSFTYELIKSYAHTHCLLLFTKRIENPL
jgi:hypothetical protein